MTQQRKPQVRPESAETTSKLDDALAILAAHRRDVILEAVAMSAKDLDDLRVYLDELEARRSLDLEPPINRLF
jgi:hypothetical protein